MGNIMSFTFDLFNRFIKLTETLWSFLTYEITLPGIDSSIVPVLPQTVSVLGLLSGVGISALIIWSIVKN